MFGSFGFKTSIIALFIQYLLLVAVIVKSNSSVTHGSGVVWTEKCPCRKCDTDELGRKRVVCDEGGRLDIPTNYMDKSAHILIFTAPPNKQNQVIIGRIFLEFETLQEIYITYSNVPAIGDSSFWPGRQVQLLDLSFNNITILRDTDFNGLNNLMTLNLSDNSLEGSPSAPFRFIRNLTRLSLARNKLTKLVPRLFYRLEKLECLDLNGNPLREIEPEDVKDLKPLRQLYLMGCQLTKLHSLVYQSLPNLEELDLRDNQFEYLSSSEYSYLKKLKNLYLDGNKLKLIAEHTFSGLKLDRLGLSRNLINSFELCAFCNLTVKELDISVNKITEFSSDLTEPLSTSLIILNAENNFDLKDSATSVANLIRPLKSIRNLSLSSMNLDDSIPSNVFLNQRETLVLINLSGNKFVNISAKLFEGLKHLEVLDLSSNLMYGMNEMVMETISSLPLVLLNLDSNPWSCYRCHILPLMTWTKTSPPSYINACFKQEISSCAKCSHPMDLIGKELYEMDEWNLEWCADPTVQLRMSTTEPNVGLVLALLIIISLIIVIIAIIILYRKQGATYYTHEDELRFDDKTVFSVSSAVQRFANATASPPLSPDSPTSVRSSTSSSPTTHTRASAQSPHSTDSQSSLPSTPSPHPSSNSSPPDSSKITKPKIPL